MLRRAIRRATTTLLGLILLAPVLALLPAAVLDIGPEPESRTRFSLFPLALTALDPLIWTSLWNSVAVALIVAAGSLVIGVGLGGVVTGFRFWGRRVLAALITAPAIITPAFLALGVLGLFNPSGPRGIGVLLDLIARAEGDSARTWPWLVWVWAALIQGVALVALTTRSARGHLHPFDRDAARLAGARPLWVWWTLTWPALRPSVLSAVYLVFMINLADPAAPLVLGLRRTLGFQMVTAALGPDPFPRLAAIALIVLAITLAGRTLVWWRGSSLPGDLMPGHDRYSPNRQMQIAAWPRAAVLLLILGCWSLLAWMPAWGLLRICRTPATYPGHAHPLGSPVIVDLWRRLTTDPAPRLLAHSAVLGLGVMAIVCVLARRPARGPVDGGLARGWRGALAVLAVLVPPLVAGAGVLALGRTAMLCSRFFVVRLEWTRAGLWMERLALALDPFCSPGLLVFVGICLAFLPRRLAARPEPPGRDEASARRVDQIRIAGAGRGPVIWHAWHRARAIPLPRLVLWGMLAATAITPPLVLAPTLESRPIGPGIVVLTDQPDDARAQAAALALAAIALNLLALGWASAGLSHGGDLEAADLV